MGGQKVDRNTEHVQKITKAQDACAEIAESGQITPSTNNIMDTFANNLAQTEDDYIQPEITTTASTDNATLTIQEPKQKRTRRPWVYKSELDDLRSEYEKLRIYGIIGWALFFTTVLLVVVVQLSEI